jgi:signal transduction histidine kinase
MQLQAALAVFDQDPEKAVTIFKASQVLAKHAIQDIRKSVKHLREVPERIEKLSEQVSFVIKNAEATGVTCSLRVNGKETQPPPEISLTILRILQEAISNALKHSRASRLDIDLDFSNGDLIRLRIEDDGIGLVKSRQGFGFTSMKERVALVAGNLKVETKRNKGTSIILEVPR